MLIFNEYEQYNKLMNNGFEKYPNKRDLLILCKEWSRQGTDESQLIHDMIVFCKKWNSEFNSAKSEMLLMDTLKALKKQKENPPKFEFNKNIKIYKEEVDEIYNIKDKKLQKIAFVMVCLSKWRNANYIYLNSKSSISPKIICDLAGVKITAKQQKQYLHILNDIGFINVQLKPLLKCFIPCIKETPNIILNFEINDNMIFQWNNLVNPKCEMCGMPFDRITNNQKYCKSCAADIRRLRDVERKKKIKIPHSEKLD